jgi:hypothetical protein
MKKKKHKKIKEEAEKKENIKLFFILNKYILF